MNLTCGHYEDRRYEALRWNLINCNTQCETCNGEHNIDRQPYTDWMNENHPLSIEVFKILKLRHIKTTRDDLIEAYELLVEGANHVSESF